MSSHTLASPRHAPELAELPSVPEPALEGDPSFIDTSDRRVDVLVTVRQPRIVVFGNLLSGDECDELIEHAGPRLTRSCTMDHDSGENVPNPARTSDTCMFERGELPVCRRIEQRLAELLRWPLTLGEGLQVLRYGVGARYEPHHDYFDPRQAGAQRLLQRRPQRVATMLMYLQSPAAGGGTAFPFAGLEVAPARGCGVFFSYATPSPESRTLHAGKPVLRGEKMVATKWLCAREPAGRRA